MPNDQTYTPGEVLDALIDTQNRALSVMSLAARDLELKAPPEMIKRLVIATTDFMRQQTMRTLEENRTITRKED